MRVGSWFACVAVLLLAATGMASCKTAPTRDFTLASFDWPVTPQDATPNPEQARAEPAPVEPLPEAATVPLERPPALSEPWKHPSCGLVIDAYWDNPIDWDALATEKRVVAVVHKATQGFTIDEKYALRKQEALQRGYLWGSYHLGARGKPEEQADFYLKTTRPAQTELIALDLEDLDRRMSIAEAARFIQRIREKTGRYPLVYGNHDTIERVSEEARGNAFANCPLWYARFRKTIPDLPNGVWSTYTLWQFSSEYTVQVRLAGTKKDIDVNVYSGTVDELRRAWPFS
jgi:GH25 family lysozyme M1 (1,4-beta-N-acetylmuramidase)